MYVEEKFLKFDLDGNLFHTLHLWLKWLSMDSKECIIFIILIPKWQFWHLLDCLMLPDIFIHLHMKLLLQIRNRWCTSTNAVDTAQTLLVDRHATLSCSTAWGTRDSSYIHNFCGYAVSASVLIVWMSKHWRSWFIWIPSVLVTTASSIVVS